LLTFFGNRGKIPTSASTDAIGNALTSFGIGILASVVLFAVAYFTQLYYGNVGFKNPATALRWMSYLALLVALGSFIFGIWFAKIAVVGALT
jgi:VIT1/CCC1 family predicted Fe2+/Mn2+ transporter